MIIFTEQDLRVSPLLLPPRPAHLPGHEEKDPRWSVRVPQAGVGQRLGGLQESD